MTSHRFLSVYSTRYGQTARIAERMARVLRDRGHVVTVFNGDELPPGFTLDAFDAVIIGASVIGGKHQRCITQFVKDHAAQLKRLPGAFFSVSGAAAASAPAEQARAGAALEAFLTDVGWQPEQRATVAGAIAYRKYNPLLRFVMKLISRSGGLSTDTSRDHEYTDWAQVDAFATGFAASLDAAAVGQPGVTVAG
jgi:menaquinone-dependent protoporphyrinogen oxidase